MATDEADSEKFSLASLCLNQIMWIVNCQALISKTNTMWTSITFEGTQNLHLISQSPTNPETFYLIRMSCIVKSFQNIIQNISIFSTKFMHRVVQLEGEYLYSYRTVENISPIIN